jgi:DNA-directed RNA polymerase specialized sigma24 family protein
VPIDVPDAAVLEDLYDAYGASCYRLAHRMVAEEQRACTIVRDVFLAVWARETVFDPARGSVQTWLLGVTHRSAAAELRRSPGESGVSAETFNDLALAALRRVAAAREGRQHSYLIAKA